jgi:hypothetical protein
VIFARKAEDLLAAQPGCQTVNPSTKMADCDPGCVHEQLQVKRARAYALLGIEAQLDDIAASLTVIARHQ